MLQQAKWWHAVETKDKSFDGAFLYGVRTTGIFCRPGCPSRTPKRENLRFYKTADEAKSDGLRACLRCRPLDAPDAASSVRFREVCTYIRRNLEDSEAMKLASLSRRVGLSPFHFQRTFKAVVGVTPRQFVEELRLQTFKEDLKTAATVTDAIYSAGFGSNSRVYAVADTRLGMTPRQLRGGGRDVEISYATASTSLGLILIGATDRGLCFLEFGASRAELLASLRQEYPAAKLLTVPVPYSDQFTGWMQSLSNYIKGESALGRMTLALHGTTFQLKVWRYLQTIPSGSVQSYTEVAQAIGHPQAVRAVASACAANRIAIVIPCHRVIRGDGGLGGYRWGLDRKRTLLDNERRASDRSSDPAVQQSPPPTRKRPS